MSCCRRLFHVAIASLFVFSSCSLATFELGLGDDFDLTNFVTRPDIKAPILNVTKYHPERVAGGYFFTAPYIEIYQERWPKGYYRASQTGPHVYDNDGGLIWSGAYAFSNKNHADFRPVYINGSWYLSGIELGLQHENKHAIGSGNRTGHGFSMDASYVLQTKFRTPKAVNNFNMHEFQLVDHGRSALFIMDKPEYTDVSMLEGIQREAGWVNNMGFIEVDAATGKLNFQWWAVQNVDLTESAVQPQDISGPLPKAWDYLHINSVDKSPEGDYLISSKHTNTIYKISRNDGSIQWRLGGKQSDFHMKGFDVSRQYDARFINPEQMSHEVEKSLEYVSFFNNPVNQNGNEQVQSPSMLIVALDLKQKTARLVRQTNRPGGQTSTSSSGNSHLLPNGNLFASWADNGHVTEHDAKDNRMVMEARFLSHRFKTYRTYKSDFQAVPSEPIALYCAAFGTSAAKATTACWVSWNGATREVERYRFRSSSSSSEKSLEGQVLKIVERKGFETSMQARGFTRFVIAEALDASGEVLGRSEPAEVYVAQPWKD